MIQSAINTKVEELSSKWWIFLLRGIAAIIVAVIAFMQPGAALIALVVVLGIYSFVAGVLAITATFMGAGGDRWWGLLFEGIILVVAGFLIWSWPITSAIAFVYFVAAWMIVTGILEIATGVKLRDVIDNEWLYILGGVISIGFGIWVFRSPVQGTVATAFLFGWYFMLFGILQVAVAFRVRSLHAAATKAAGAT